MLQSTELVAASRMSTGYDGEGRLMTVNHSEESGDEQIKLSISSTKFAIDPIGILTNSTTNTSNLANYENVQGLESWAFYIEVSN